mmetsp:Transcript_6584/g.5878  ORF Transcript_6584/g.5878 Transcript_6584/m.5878 type:complete len:126 (+) Transcript_6584:67-444(+)
MTIKTNSLKNQTEEDQSQKIKRAFEEYDFIDRDLQQHIGRMYLFGNNTFFSPWQISKSPPMAIRHKVIKAKYEEFINALHLETEWTKWTRVCYVMLIMVYPVFGPSVLKWQRRKHYDQFKANFVR